MPRAAWLRSLGTVCANARGACRFGLTVHRATGATAKRYGFLGVARLRSIQPEA